MQCTLGTMLSVRIPHKSTWDRHGLEIRQFRAGDSAHRVEPPGAAWVFRHLVDSHIVLHAFKHSRVRKLNVVDLA